MDLITKTEVNHKCKYLIRNLELDRPKLQGPRRGRKKFGKKSPKMLIKVKVIIVFRDNNSNAFLYTPGAWFNSEIQIGIKRVRAKGEASVFPGSGSWQNVLIFSFIKILDYFDEVSYMAIVSESCGNWSSCSDYIVFYDVFLFYNNRRNKIHSQF